MSFAIGGTVGTYKIIESVGTGGIGEVFQVEHIVTGRIEAMKVLSSAATGAREEDQRFLREIRLQAGLSCPNIVAVHNAFWENGRLVLIMELISGTSLRALLERGKLSLESALNYACQALAAISYAHMNGVVHRDISTGNMIIAEDGTLKLMDFGLAKSQNDIRLTQTGAILGSLHYTSPEQLRGNAPVDARSDIYSLAAVLYEMVTGVTLFNSENPYTLMLAHVEQPPRPASEVYPNLPSDLDEILLKALDKDPEKRFQSAEIFRCALENLKNDSNDPRAIGLGSEQRHQDAGTRALEPTIARGRSASFLTTLRSPIVLVGAIFVLVFLIGCAWKSLLFPQTTSAQPLAAGAPPAAVGVADVPMNLPSNLLPPSEPIYPAVRKSSISRTAATRPRPVSLSQPPVAKPPKVSLPQTPDANPTRAATAYQEIAVTAEQKSDFAVEQQTLTPKRKHNRFMRAMGRIVHPLRRDGESNIRVTYTGAPGFVGLDQINCRVPAGLVANASAAVVVSSGESACPLP